MDVLPKSSGNFILPFMFLDLLSIPQSSMIEERGLYLSGLFCNRVLWPFHSERATIRSRGACAMKTRGRAEEKAEGELMGRLVSREGKTRDPAAAVFVGPCQVPCWAADVAGRLRGRLPSQSGQVWERSTAYNVLLPNSREV